MVPQKNGGGIDPFSGHDPKKHCAICRAPTAFWNNKAAAAALAPVDRALLAHGSSLGIFENMLNEHFLLGDASKELGAIFAAGEWYAKTPAPMAANFHENVEEKVNVAMLCAAIAASRRSSFDARNAISSAFCACSRDMRSNRASRLSEPAPSAAILLGLWVLLCWSQKVVSLAT